MNTGTDKSLRTAWRIALVVTVSVLVLTFSQGASLVAAKKKRPVNVNTASLAELEAVKGVGPTTAKEIISNRPYKSLEELSKAGLSAKKIKSFASSLSVGAGSAPSAFEAAGKEKKTSREERKKSEAKAVTKAKESKAPAAEEREPVDLNTASLSALEALPGVGRATAKKIVAARPFRSVDDLSKVKGMSKGKVEALKDKVTVAGAPARSVPAPAVQKPSTPPESEPPAKPAASAKEKGRAGKLIAGQKVDINTAGKEELDKLPDIGSVKARAIIEGRPYHKIEDIMKVKGIKQHTFDRIKDYITVR
ncbi:MAG: helix-hairpin-helix domain-containing protein [Syntrophobacteraceae bacterium]|nr:helix-hairpin-helix domain-containing protein [Syntrophobacteraceae bacterium]